MAEVKTRAEVREVIREHIPQGRIADMVRDIMAIVKREEDEIRDRLTKKLEKHSLARRMKYAETTEIMNETGMTLEQIREWNLYSDGYNARGVELRAELNPPEPEEPVV